jgi:cellulose synthase/poly-beta-1,6-N-acetylglucosamine synthase-like glycosyltransferase
MQAGRKPEFSYLCSDEPENMLLIASLLTCVYCLLTLFLWFHWRSIRYFYPVRAHKPSDRVSVIIPVRNEAANIQQLLADLDRQCWPDGTHFSEAQLEVIVVDDDSEDATASLVEDYTAHCFSLRLLSLDVPAGFTGSHKKLALSQAIRQASGEFIITTDGDCRVQPQWVAHILSFMSCQNLVLVSGPVTFGCEKNLFERLQTIEFASLIGTGAACMQAGAPNMCNGANLAFRRSAFERVEGYAGSMHIPSGDDEFLLQKIFQQYPGQLAFLKNREAVVQTRAQPDLRGFYYQRKRWAGKWKLHKKLSTAALALLIFGFHATLITIALMTMAGYFPLGLFLGILLAKGTVEFLLLDTVLRNMDKKLHILNFVLLQLIYSAYAVFFGIVANFGGYQWKARRYAA